MTGAPIRSTEPKECTCPRVKHVHGTPQCYRRDRCRCNPCATAFKRYKHALGAPRDLVSAVGIHRRLDALATLGWTHRDVANRLGISSQAVNLARSRDWAFPDAIARYAAVYDELWDQLPPLMTTNQRISANRCVKRAQRLRYAPPLAWDDDTIDDPAAKPAGISRRSRTPLDIDEVAVHQVLAGCSVPLTRHERAEAVRLATERRMGAERIAELLGTTARTVQRDRKVAA